MSDFDPNAPWVAHAVQHWGEITQALNDVKGKIDPESNARRLELLEDLMCADMNLGPMRKAMCQGKQPESSEPSEGDTP